jgi:AcrR family transcriptional regulator
MTGPTRQRLIAAASTLLRRQGLAATGIKQIVSASGTQFSSLYHHFPGGKDQLAAEAVIVAGTGYQQQVAAVWDRAARDAAGDVTAGVAAVFDGAAQVLEDTDFADACPIATVALEVASTNESLRLATAEVFAGWVDAGISRLIASGVPARAARPLAESVIALLEGAFILSRAAKNTQPMHAARDAAVTLVGAATRGRAAGYTRRSPVSRRRTATGK